jgi:myosin heavy subunit
MNMQHDQPCTHIGPVLISLNPHKPLNIYGEEEIQRYNGKTHGQEPPHIFMTAEMAYRGMLRENKPQAVIISGESGAGKTEASKLILRYIFSAASKQAPSASSCPGARSAGTAVMLTERILGASPVLEAFGNAKTQRNSNSSRFGKFTQVFFDPHCA